MMLPIYRPDAPASDPVLGTAALDRFQMGSLHDRNAEYFAATGDPDLAARAAENAEQYAAETIELLDDVRKRLQTAPKRPELLDAYIDSFIGQEFDDAYNRGDTDYEDIVTWLGAGIEMGGASDVELFTFLSRHVQHIERQRQSPETREVVDKTKQLFAEDIQNAVAAGWLSSHALDKLGKVKDVNIVVGDVWDTFLQNHQAYHVDGKSYIVIGQNIGVGATKEDLLENIRRSLPHEFCHLLFDDGRELPAWLEEGLAEHINLLLSHGQPGVIDPDQRRDDGAYDGYRRMLAGMLTSTQHRRMFQDKNQLLKAALHAYTSPPASTEWQVFFTLLDEEWGPNSFEMFDYIIEQETKHLQDESAEYKKDAVSAAFTAAGHVAVMIPQLRKRAAASRQPGSHSPEHRRPEGRHKRKPQRHIGAAAVRAGRR
jgi:hypothetical protein